MMIQRVEIERTGRHGRVDVDGQDMSTAVSGVIVDMTGDVTEVWLTVPVKDVTVQDGAAQVHVHPDGRDLLIAAGWTPPVDEAVRSGP